MIFRRPKREARSEYRVDGQAGHYVVLRTEAGPVQAQIRDISAHGCGAVIPKDSAGGIEAGKDYPLRIVVEQTGGRPLFLRGVVRSAQSDPDGSLRVGIQFIEVERLFPQLSAAQWKYFNRRAAFRVTPTDPASDPLEVRFTGAGLDGTVPLVAYDLSELGLGLHVPSGGPQFLIGEPMRARFELPGRPGTLDVGLTVVHFTPMQEGPDRLGVSINDDSTRISDSTHESIGDWVVARQRVLLSRM